MAALILFISACSGGSATTPSPSNGDSQAAEEFSASVTETSTAATDLSATEPAPSPTAYPHTESVEEGHCQYTINSAPGAAAEFVRLTGAACDAPEPRGSGDGHMFVSCTLPSGENAGLIWSAEVIDPADHNRSLLLRTEEDSYYLAGANWIASSKDKETVEKVAAAYGGTVQIVPREYLFDTVNDLRKAYIKAAGDKCNNWRDLGPVLVEGEGVNGRGTCGTNLALAVFTDSYSQSRVLDQNDGNFNAANPGPFYVAGPSWYIAEEGSRSKPSERLKKVAKALNEEVLQFGVDEVYSEYN